MDRDMVRGMLIVLSILWLLGIYLWDRYKPWIKEELGRRRGAPRDEPELPSAKEPTISLVPEDSWDVLSDDWAPAAPAAAEIRPEPNRVAPLRAELPRETRPAPRQLPDLVQFSIMAIDPQGFPGRELEAAFAATGMEFGSMDIFHYYAPDSDDILFSAASIVNPGTFPLADMRHFSTPGIVLFMQPSLVDNLAEAFEQMVTACHDLSITLRGEQWNARREPLTAEHIEALRRQLGLV